MTPDDQLVLHLDGFDGPMDLLLELARGQKLDLARISILSLVEQYLAIIEGARRIRLELAADWLVMAAWLAWLKSRLLLPPGTDAAEEGEDAAGVLAARLHELQAVRDLAAWLAARPQLGQEVFGRGSPEALLAVDRSGLAADLPGLLRAYMAARRRGAAGVAYRPARAPLWTVQDAMTRLTRLLGQARRWTALEDCLPQLALDPMQRRAALASTLLAGLELARAGSADLRQEQQFGPILLRAAA